MHWKDLAVLVKASANVISYFLNVFLRLLLSKIYIWFCCYQKKLEHKESKLASLSARRQSACCLHTLIHLPFLQTSLVSWVTYGNAEQWSYVAQPSRWRPTILHRVWFFKALKHCHWDYPFFNAVNISGLLSCELCTACCCWHTVLSLYLKHLGNLFWPRIVRKTKHTLWHAHIVWKLDQKLLKPDQSSLTLLISLGLPPLESLFHSAAANTIANIEAACC